MIGPNTGTEWAVGSHSLGEPFVMLNLAALLRSKDTVADLSLERSYRAVSIGEVIESEVVRTFKNTRERCTAISRS